MKLAMESDINLKKIIKQLCTTNIRANLTIDRVFAWLKQFKGEEEQRLALLILVNLIYRDSKQLTSALTQALKKAAQCFGARHISLVDLSWREIVSGDDNQITFYYGPPLQSNKPGKSGEVITRLLTRSFGIPKSRLYHLQDFGNTLDDDDYFLLVDDGIFTANQIKDYLNKYIQDHGNNLIKSGKLAIVVALAHENAIQTISDNFPEIQIFYGEKLSKNEGFESLCTEWVSSKAWTYESNPFDIYCQVLERANFTQKYDSGFGNLGLLVAYEHGVPDNSLQLLWDNSNSWSALIDR